MSRRPSRRLCTALVALLASAALFAAGHASASGSSSAGSSYCKFKNHRFSGKWAFVGIAAPDVQNNSQPYRACTFGRMAADHIGMYRYDMDWIGVEYRPGVFNWSHYDAIMTELALHNVKFLPILMSPPPFRSAGPPGRNGYPPKHVADFARFASLAVRRYGPRGTFWRMHPGLPRDPIRSWQIWNEPSLPVFWEPKPNALAYTRLLRAAYQAIKRVDPSAEVVTAGIPWYAIGKFAQKYYTEMFRDGAGRYFDALAFHAYAPTPSESIARVIAVRKLLDRFGLQRKALWVTEWGWADSGPAFPYVAGRKQVPYTEQFLRWIGRNRFRYGIQKIFYYCWRDAHPVPPNKDWWGNHMGIYRWNLSPKPVAAVLARFAAQLDQ